VNPEFHQEASVRHELLFELRNFTVRVKADYEILKNSQRYAKFR
jgi:hypothetical protein